MKRICSNSESSRLGKKARFLSQVKRRRWSQLRKNLTTKRSLRRSMRRLRLSREDRTKGRKLIQNFRSGRRLPKTSWRKSFNKSEMNMNKAWTTLLGRMILVS
jgi:hypothetical protein